MFGFLAFFGVFELPFSCFLRDLNAGRATLGQPNAGKHERRKANRQNFTSKTESGATYEADFF
jgi:hypothetical protein